jgi:hypothetical protein
MSSGQLPPQPRPPALSSRRCRAPCSSSARPATPRN